MEQSINEYRILLGKSRVNIMELKIVGSDSMN